MVTTITTCPNFRWLDLAVIRVEIAITYNSIAKDAVRDVEPSPVTNTQPNVHQIVKFPRDKYGSTNSITVREMDSNTIAHNIITLTKCLLSLEFRLKKRAKMVLKPRMMKRTANRYTCAGKNQPNSSWAVPSQFGLGSGETVSAIWKCSKKEQRWVWGVPSHIHWRNIPNVCWVVSTETIFWEIPVFCRAKWKSQELFQSLPVYSCDPIRRTVGLKTGMFFTALLQRRSVCLHPYDAIFYIFDVERYPHVGSVSTKLMKWILECVYGTRYDDFGRVYRDSWSGGLKQRKEIRILTLCYEKSQSSPHW